MVVIMSKRLFTDAQVKKLSKNKWIKNITNKAITYTDEFKYKLVKECEDYEKFPQDVFRECGIDPEIVGRKRYEQAAYKWRKQLNSVGEIKDTRKGTSGRHLEHELSDKEKLFLSTPQQPLRTAPKLTCNCKIHPRQPTVSLQYNNSFSKNISLASALR